ncbi:hypothetical protein E8E11_000076, partial [Didymella keratinophila]
MRKGVKLVQYYDNLVTLYILAYHKEEFDLLHRHEEGDDEYTACRKTTDGMEEEFNKIRSREAEQEYDEAKTIVDDYVKSLRSQPMSVDTGQNSPIKRKAESLTVSAHKKFKRGGARGRGR